MAELPLNIQFVDERSTPLIIILGIIKHTHNVYQIFNFKNEKIDNQISKHLSPQRLKMLIFLKGGDITCDLYITFQ